MLAIERKISDFPSSRYKIVSYCSFCHNRFLIKQDLHPETTLESLQQTIPCPKCGTGHLSVSVLLNKG